MNAHKEDWVVTVWRGLHYLLFAWVGAGLCGGAWVAYAALTEGPRP